MEDQPNYMKKVVGKDIFFIANGHTYDDKDFVWKLKSETIQTNHYFCNQGASMEKSWFLPGIGGSAPATAPSPKTCVVIKSPETAIPRAIATLRHYISIAALTMVHGDPTTTISVIDLMSAHRMLAGIAGVSVESKDTRNMKYPPGPPPCPLTAESLRHAVAGIGLTMTILSSCTTPEYKLHPRHSSELRLALRELNKALFGTVAPGKFVVSVIGCKDIESKDGGKESVGRYSDPYVVFTCTPLQVFKTKTVQDNPNPSFDQKFSVSVEDVTTASFQFVVMDADDHNKDDLIGVVVLQMPFCELGKSAWYALSSPAKKGTAENSMRVHFFGRADVRIWPASHKTHQPNQRIPAK